MASKGPYYLTTAIAYTSGKPHIGNTYEIVLADAIARFRRLEGYDVRFQTGSDEHGQKIEEKAKAAGVTPKAYVDGTVAEIKRIWDLMNTSYDRFIRTTDPDHERQVQKIFKKLYDQGDIYKSSYEGWYCVPDESFWTESQLVDGKCPDCGRPVVKASEEAYFFRMSKYADRLIDHINTHPEFIQPVSRKNEMMNNFLLPGLQDLCVSRSSFKWGIPVDFDPGHVVYVWLDALTNYITGLGYDCGGESDELYKKYWPADLHLIGKDIIRFHTIYWPIFLMALGEPLPKQVFGHPWLIQSDGKMSKSRGNVLYADDLCDVFGVDAVRFFVLHEMPYENDGVISWELLTERINTELANVLGNLVNRTVSMSNKYFDGAVRSTGVRGPEDDSLEEAARSLRGRVEALMAELRVADAMTEIFALFRRCNKYIDETMPWALAKDPEKQDRLSEVLAHLVESIRMGATLLAPFMPETAERIFVQIGLGAVSYDKLDTVDVIPEGTRVTEKPEILFARLDPDEVAKRSEEIAARQAAASGISPEETMDGIGAAQTESAESAVGTAGSDSDSAAGPAAEKETGAEPTPIHVEQKDEISYDDFAKLQFAVGTIVKCEEVPKSKKLLCSQVRIGDQTRQIVSGIKKWYRPEDMVGRQVVVVLNLKPAKLAGLLSEGMILAAEDDEDNVVLVSPEKPVKDGSEVC